MGLSKQRGSRAQRRHPAKMPGETYADVLARKRKIMESVEKASEDAVVQFKADRHTQRAMWLMVVSIADAFGIGPERMSRDFFPHLQENSDDLARMTKENGEDYAFEKLRHRAEQVTGIDIAQIYENDDMVAAMLNARKAVDSDGEC